MYNRHGMVGTRIYRIWENMKKRCNNPNAINYKRYGAKGITVCDSWKEFTNFYEDMKETYDDKLTLDRIDNSKGYYKENCKWSTNLEQANNKLNNAEMIGSKFGKLKVVSFDHYDNNKQKYWLCKCDCGNTKIIRQSSLRSGVTKSCGCLTRELSSQRMTKYHSNKEK